MSKLLPILSKQNVHKRDTFIHFEEKGHKYTIHSDPFSKYTSVTTWIHSHFPVFNADEVIQSMMKGRNWKEGHKYWGLTGEQIKKQWSSNGENVSGAGTNMHYEIECFMNSNSVAFPYTHTELLEDYHSQKKSDIDIDRRNTPEWSYFLKYVEDFPEMKPFRTEWLIYHEGLKLAGSIDMVYENPDGTLSIYDWKRSKEITKINKFNKFAKTECISHLPDANFWHYALQLNLYKAILEDKYEKKVTSLCLVRLHPDAETYELIDVPFLTQEIKDMFEAKGKNKGKQQEETKH
jgi:ATP-dependent exoDNAse (exonuclease V) beta subunit